MKQKSFKKKFDFFWWFKINTLSFCKTFPGKTEIDKNKSSLKDLR